MVSDLQSLHKQKETPKSACDFCERVFAFLRHFEFLTRFYAFFAFWEPQISLRLNSGGGPQVPNHIMVHNLTYTPPIDPRMAAKSSSHLKTSVLPPPVCLSAIYPQSFGKGLTLAPKVQIKITSRS